MHPEPQALLAAAESREAELLARVRELVKTELAPLTVDVDLKGVYPEAFMRRLGEIGGYLGAVGPEFGGLATGIATTVKVMEEVSKECMSTGFLVWCQTACARYIQMSDNAGAREAYLPRIASGELLAGTGLSNTVKSCDEIEAFRLKAQRVERGYRVTGTLPWVSNLGETHVFATGCPVEGEAGLVFFVVECGAADFRLQPGGQFVALEGTRTLACQFRDTFIPDARVLAHPRESEAYIRRIKPGMILAQMGMGLGLIQACANMMRYSDRTHAHVNRFLDDQADDIQGALDAARALTYELAAALARDPLADVVRAVLEVRLAGGELSLKAANAAMLHMGARGYLHRSPAQRRLREAYFVAIVTPAIKHLRKELARLPEKLAA